MLKLARALTAAFLLATAPLLYAEPLDINTATEQQLDEVMNGVGPAKAKAIVADREKNGKFKSVDDLERVKGIGPATIAKNRDKLTVGNDAAPPAADPAPARTKAPPPPAQAPAAPAKTP